MKHTENHICWCEKSTNILDSDPLNKKVWWRMICEDKHITFLHKDPEEAKKIAEANKSGHKSLHPHLVGF